MTGRSPNGRLRTWIRRGDLFASADAMGAREDLITVVRIVEPERASAGVAK